MQAVAIIPARYTSTRFPGKPLVDIAGKTMIRRVYERVKAVPSLEAVIVATDDERIYDHVTSFGGDAVMTLSTHQSGTERCAEAVEKLAFYPDIVVNVQGDEPFIATTHIEEVIRCFEDTDTQISTLVKAIEDRETLFNPHIPKVVFDDRLRALYFSRNCIPYLRDREETDWLAHHTHYKHIGIYAYRTHVLLQIVQLPPGKLETAEKLEQLRWLEHGYSIQVAITPEENVAVDTPEDLRFLLSRLK